MVIIESNTGNDLTPFLMVGELEKRIKSFWDTLCICQRFNLVKNINNFEALQNNVKSEIIKKLS